MQLDWQSLVTSFREFLLRPAWWSMFPRLADWGPHCFGRILCPSFSTSSITHFVLLAPLAPRGLSKVHSCSNITLAFWLSITISMREVVPNNKRHTVTIKQCGLLYFFVQSYARGPTSLLRVTQGIPYSFDQDSSSFVSQNSCFYQRSFYLLLPSRFRW